MTQFAALAERMIEKNGADLLVVPSAAQGTDPSAPVVDPDPVAMKGVIDSFSSFVIGTADPSNPASPRRGDRKVHFYQEVKSGARVYFGPTTDAPSGEVLSVETIYEKGAVVLWTAHIR